MEPASQNDILAQRAYWLVRLRWSAIASVIASTYLCSNVLGIVALYAIALLPAPYNLTVLLLLNHYTGKSNDKISHKAVKRIINVSGLYRLTPLSRYLLPISRVRTINFDTAIVDSNPNGILKFEDLGIFKVSCWLSCHGKKHSVKQYIYDN